MLSIFANTLRRATGQGDWNAPPHWQGPGRRPISEEEARRIDRQRRAMHYRAPW